MVITEYLLTHTSLAPRGFVFSSTQKKPGAKKTRTWIKNEMFLKILWETSNRKSASGPQPIRTIIHEILPAQSRRDRIEKGDFVHDGLPYLARDILVLSSFVQWFGCDRGNSFIERIASHAMSNSHPDRFLRAFDEEMRQIDVVALVTHVCMPTTCIPNASHTCELNSEAVSARDRALVTGLLRWLARPEGCKFIEAYRKYRGRVVSSRQRIIKEAIITAQPATHHSHRH